MSMASVQRTLIDIASASHRVIDASVAYARDKNDRNVDISRTRLGGELHKIVAASGTILKATLQPSTCSGDSTFDDRLTHWLSGDEPQACLDSLNTMEKTIRSTSNRMVATFHNPFRSAPSEDNIKEAIRIFERRRDCFHFLLTTDVWNHEMAAKDQPKVVSLDTLRTVTKQGIGLANQGANIAVSELPVKSSRKRSQVDQAQLSEISSWLDAWDCTSKHEDTLELRQPDTCTWLPDTDEYATWRTGDDSFLWLHGKPGSGKSVLAASVIDGLERTLHEGELLACFYCDFRSERCTAAAEVMRSLLFQLSRGFGDLGVDPGDILDSLNKEKRRNGSILSNAKRLALLVSRAAKRFTQQPLIVIDALDECKDIEGLLDAILMLNQGEMRLFVISRPLQVIKDSFSGLTWLSLENVSREVSADIHLHVMREVDSHRRLRIADAALKEEIIRTLCNKARGMFRWVQCQLDTLKRCVTAVEIREALESLPVGLEATYERILLTMNNEGRTGEISRRALVWLVAALEPLRLCQIVEALSIDLDRRILNPDVGPIHGHALLDTLSSLVTHDGETDIVILSHFSVKEYLVGEFSQKKHPYNIDKQDAHAQVARQCMSYMAACLELENGNSKELHPLLDYILPRGFEHLAHIKPTRSILNSIVALYSDVHRHPLRWEQMRNGLQYYTWPGLPSLEHDFVLYILIGYAPESLLRLFLGRAPLRVKEGTNPLIYAVGKNAEYARMLLSRGANLGSCGRFRSGHGRGCISGLPIEAAVLEGDYILVDLFIAEGSPVPQKLFSVALLEVAEETSTIPARVVTSLLKTDDFVEWATNIEDKTLLLRALNHSRDFQGRLIDEYMVVMTRRLTQIGCDISDYTTFMENFLHQAACAGGISTVKYLLSEFKLPLPPGILLTASKHGHSNEAMIRFLTRNEVDVHVVSDDENTALHYTMNFPREEKDCLEMTKILCGAGCDPSACNLDGHTPMHLAAAHGHISVVKHLLSVGAPLPPDILLRAVSGNVLGKIPGPAMIRFLLAEGADARAVAANGDTVLHGLLCHYLFSRGHDLLESTKILIAAGCDPAIRDSAGQTSITLAVRTVHVPLVKYLLSLHTLSLPPDILLVANHPFHDGLPMIKFLLDNGADIHVTRPDGHNALHSAVTRGTRISSANTDGCFQIVKTLVDAGCDPSACRSDGETLFHAAARGGRTKVIGYLLSRGLPLPSDVLLVVSYHDENLQTIEFLIKKGADVHAVDADGNTPLHLAVQSSTESFALEYARILIDAGSEPSALNSSYKTPMHAAVDRGYTFVVFYLRVLLRVPLPPDILLAASASNSKIIAPLVRLLVEEGADTTIVTKNGDTALHLALARGDQDDRLETTKILVGAGCDIHAHNSAGDTPFYIAARAGHIAIIKSFPSQGEPLPPNVIFAAMAGGHIDILQHFFVTQGGDFPPNIILAAAASNVFNKVAIIQFLAGLQGVDIHVVDTNGDTALHRAVTYGCLETVKILIGLGCDPSLHNSAGETPFHIAAREHHDHLPIVKYLLSQGIPLPSDVLLSAASARRNMAPMMRLLIREGADPCAANDNGDTPLHILPKHDVRGLRWKDIQILLDAGGDPRARNLDGQTPVDLAESKGPLYAQNLMRLAKQVQKL
ncbi:ankyrin [Imleria badia]|nr:ankyrin [Imleria badia]